MGLHKESRILVQTKNGEKEIQLCVGDITSLPVEERVDVVLISAFPYDYSAMRTSVIGALKFNLGIDVRKLASFHVKEDLRQSHNCWISKPLPATVPYGQIMCYEHKYGNEITVLKSVDGLFRAMMPLFNNQNKSVITPLLATGFQVVDRPTMVKEMINVAVSWMQMGLPLQTLKIVVYANNLKSMRNDERSAIEMFYHMKKNVEQRPVLMKEPPIKTDVFLVYSDMDENLVSVLKNQLLKKKHTKRVLSLSQAKLKDESWKHDIFTEMLSSARIVPLLSKNFLEAEICVDQYNIATCCNRFANRNILAPLCLERFDVPLYMSMVQWINCRERDTQKVKDAAVALDEQIENSEHPTAKDYDVFLSYSHKNLDYAKQVMELLQKSRKNLKIFFDYDELKTGVSWQQTLYHAIDSSRSVISLISKNYIKSDVCKEEFNLAVTKHSEKGGDECQVIAVLIEPPTDELVSFLGDFPYVDGSGHSSSREVSLQNICQALTTWISAGTVDPQVFGPAKVPIDLSVISSLKRKELFDKLYTFNKADNEFKLTKQSLSNLKETNQAEDTKAGCDIFLSSSLWDQHYVHFILERLKKYQPALRLGDKSQSPENQISEARCCVVVLSAKYLQSPKEVEELNLILSRQRAHKTVQVMYILRVGDLKASPYYPGVLWCDTCLTDNMWAEFTSAQTEGDGTASVMESSDIVKLCKDAHTEFKKTLQAEEVTALLKCVCDLDAVLTMGRYHTQGHQDSIFVNAHSLSRDLQEEDSAPTNGTTDDNILCVTNQQTHGNENGSEAISPHDHPVYVEERRIDEKADAKTTDNSKNPAEDVEPSSAHRELRSSEDTNTRQEEMATNKANETDMEDSTDNNPAKLGGKPGNGVKNTNERGMNRETPDVTSKAGDRDKKNNNKKTTAMCSVL